MPWLLTIRQEERTGAHPSALLHTPLSPQPPLALLAPSSQLGCPPPVRCSHSNRGFTAAPAHAWQHGRTPHMRRRSGGTHLGAGLSCRALLAAALPQQSAAPCRGGAGSCGRLSTAPPGLAEPTAFPGEGAVCGLAGSGAARAELTIYGQRQGRAAGRAGASCFVPLGAVVLRRRRGAERSGGPSARLRPLRSAAARA